MTRMQARRGVVVRFVLTAAVALLASGAPIVATPAGATTASTGRSTTGATRPATDHPVLFSRSHRVLSVASPRSRPERSILRRTSDSSTAAVSWNLLAVLLSVGLAAAASRRRSGAERRNLASRGPPAWATTT